MDTLAPRRRRWWALGFALLGFVILVALAYYEPSQSSNVKSPPDADNPNPLGLGGANLIFLLFTWFGIAAWCVPCILFTAAYVCFADLSRRGAVLKLGSAFVFSLSLSVLAGTSQANSGANLTMDQIYWKGPGGALGGYLY
ncbi:MAG: DNA translocase FtsK 4TM domain-containing protein, partial [Opitutales bacterium]